MAGIRPEKSGILSFSARVTTTNVCLDDKSIVVLNAHIVSNCFSLISHQYQKTNVNHKKYVNPLLFQTLWRSLSFVTLSFPISISLHDPPFLILYISLSRSLSLCIFLSLSNIFLSRDELSLSQVCQITGPRTRETFYGTFLEKHFRAVGGTHSGRLKG